MAIETVTLRAFEAVQAPSSWYCSEAPQEFDQDEMNMTNITDKEAGAFRTRFCPFADRLYRGALIVTDSPGSAAQLHVDVYLKAFVEYLLAGRIDNFENWLAEIVRTCFAEYQLQRGERYFQGDAVYEAFQAKLRKLAACKQYAQNKSQKYVAIPN